MILLIMKKPQICIINLFRAVFRNRAIKQLCKIRLCCPQEMHRRGHDREEEEYD